MRVASGFMIFFYNSFYFALVEPGTALLLAAEVECISCNIIIV
jgi:hypothetical protein